MRFRRPEHEVGVFIVGLFSLACGRSEMIRVRWPNSPREVRRLVLPVYVRSFVNWQKSGQLRESVLVLGLQKSYVALFFFYFS